MIQNDPIVPTDTDVRNFPSSINEANAAARRLKQQSADFTSRQGDIRRRYLLAPMALHPFSVYLAQMAFGPENNPVEDDATWWRTFLVRCGEVGSVPLSGNGCDGWDNDPFDDYLPQETGNDASGQPLIPITCPDNTAQYFFWIELQKAGPVLRSGTNPAAPAADGTGQAIKNPWLNYPQPDGLHFLLAEVCTNSPPATGPAIIRQYLVADINNGILIGGCDETGASLNLILPLAYQQNPPN